MVGDNSGALSILVDEQASNLRSYESYTNFRSDFYLIFEYDEIRNKFSQAFFGSGNDDDLIDSGTDNTDNTNDGESSSVVDNNEIDD